MSKPEVRVIVVGCGANESLITYLTERNPGAEIITVAEAESRGLLLSEVVHLFRSRPAPNLNLRHDLILAEFGKRKKDWLPAKFPSNKKKRK